ncbi:MAG: penicillin-binding protein [Deltaproteobacteria bacterium]|nr:penicillin-binding protein [Deltaproteobacteria bacterium]
MQNDRRTGIQVNMAKMKTAALLGLALGLFLTATLAARGNSAAGNEPSDVVHSLARMASLLPTGGIETAVRLLRQESEQAAPRLEPASFIDTSFEMLDLAATTVGKNPTLELEGGRKISFTLRPDLQKEAEKVFEQYRPHEAAFVALDPRTGEVLALAGYADGKLAPHRALQAEGPAASVYKVITGAALVEGKGVSSAKEVCYHGGGSGIAKSHLVHDPDRDHTCHSLAEAMGRSANVVFARLAFNLLTRGEMKAFAERFGFNQVLPFEWPVEVSRVDVPDNRLEFARMAAGFYHSTLSPFHGALLAAAVANGGRMMRPGIVSEVTERDGTVSWQRQPELFLEPISAQTAGILCEMMQKTVTDGTARKYFSRRTPGLKGVTVAGKTGSLSETHEGVRYHYSWFVGFAPADDPKIAFASLVVNDPNWKVKGPVVARRVLDRFFQEDSTPHHRTARR